MRWLLVDHVLRRTTKTSCVVVYTYTVSFIYGCINQHSCTISLLLCSYFPERGWQVFEYLLTNMSVVEISSSISVKARLGFAAGLILHSPGTFQRVKPASWQFAKILLIKIHSWNYSIQHPSSRIFKHQPRFRNTASVPPRYVKKKKRRPGSKHSDSLWLPARPANNCANQKETGQGDARVSSENHAEREGQQEVAWLFLT